MVGFLCDVAKTHNYTFQVNTIKDQRSISGFDNHSLDTHSIYTFYYRYHHYYGHLNYDWLSQCCDGRCLGYVYVCWVLHVQVQCIKTKTTYSGRQRGTNNNNSNKYYFYREMTNNFVEKFAWTGEQFYAWTVLSKYEVVLDNNNHTI